MARQPEPWVIVAEPSASAVFLTWRPGTPAVEQPEAAIGRTKLSEVEPADDVKPPDSQVALNVIEDADASLRNPRAAG